MPNKTDLPDFAYLENTLDSTQNSYYFSEAQDEVLCTDGNLVRECFERLSVLQKKGLYLVGYISYEAAYYLNPDFSSLQTVATQATPSPLLHFLAFKSYSTQPPFQLSRTHPCTEAAVDLIIDSLSLEKYTTDFNIIEQALRDGESYQINYTKRIKLRSPLPAVTLYQQLKTEQPVSYSAFLPFSPMTVLSFSPELFFRKESNTITMKPMKGTSARFSEPKADSDSYHFLQNDPKNKAENLIIVDLLRNDLARICHTGSIEVVNSFAIETYKSVYQMTSTICGEVDIDIPFIRLIESLFPCGSITGAPKKRTLEIIQKLESLRHLYTGCIGYIMPNNDMCFSVAIRTLTQLNQGLWHCGVGGGFTIQSTQTDEWQEMTTKINFIKRLYQPCFNLIETMLYNNQGLRSCDLHLHRLIRSARQLHFHIDIDIAKIKSSLLQFCEKLNLSNNQQYKIRVEVDYKGYFNITHQKLSMESHTEKIELFLYPKPIDSHNPLWQHKTTDQSTRGFYSDAHSKYINDKLQAELVFYNEHQHVTESRFYNIVVEFDGNLYTPPITDGLLPGIARAKLININEIIERSITLSELKRARNIYLINDVRGKITAYLSDRTILNNDVN